MKRFWLGLLALTVILLPSLGCFDAAVAEEDPNDPNNPYGPNGPGNIKSFTAEKPKVTKGTSAKLTAVFENGSASIDNGIGEVTSGVPVETPALAGKTTYVLTAQDENGENHTARLDVDAVEPAVITSFKAEKVIRPGQSTNLIPVFSNGAGVIEGIGPVQSGVPVPTGVVAATKNYKLIVTNEVGDSVTAIAEVEAAVQPVITSFTAPGSTVSRLAPMALNAVFLHGKGTVDMNVGPIVSGTPTMTPPVPFVGGTYTLTVTNGLGEKATKSLSVTTKKEMFVTNYDANIFVWDFDAQGDIPAKRTIETHTGKNANSGIEGLLGILVTADTIYLANENGTPAINAFNIGDRGDVAPKRKITASAGITWVPDVQGPYLISMSGNELFVADKSSTIRVWNTTDTGAVAPKRVLEGPATGLDQCFGTWVDSGELYVTNLANQGGGESVTVYAVGASGNTPPKRTIPLSGEANTPSGVLIEGNEMFIVSRTAITAFNKNTGAQLRQLFGANAGIDVQAGQCSISDGEIFCSIDNTNDVKVWDVTANGNVAPKRKVGGPKTTLEQNATVVVF